MAELERGASLRILIDEVWAMHQRVAARIQAETDQEVRAYRWFPLGSQPATPCIFLVLTDAPFEQRDLARWRDNINLAARLIVSRGTDENESGDLERFADIYRQVVDGELSSPPPHLNNSAELAERRGMRLTTATFNSIDFLGFEFPLYCRLERFPEYTD